MYNYEKSTDQPHQYHYSNNGYFAEIAVITTAAVFLMDLKITLQTQIAVH